MVYPLIGMVLGVSAGALGGPLVATLGAVLGFVVGMMVAGVAEATRRAPPGATLAQDQRSILCVPKGQVATTTFVRDAGSGQWLDVARCTLCEPEDHVECQKRCLLLVRDALPARATPLHPATVGGSAH